MFSCSKCNHQWFQRSTVPPRRCPNHSCRSVYWNLGQPIKEPIPTLLKQGESHQEKLAAAFGLLKELEKPKVKVESTPHPALPTYAQSVDEWGEVIRNID